MNINPSYSKNVTIIFIDKKFYSLLLINNSKRKITKAKYNNIGIYLIN